MTTKYYLSVPARIGKVTLSFCSISSSVELTVNKIFPRFVLSFFIFAKVIVVGIHTSLDPGFPLTSSSVMSITDFSMTSPAVIVTLQHHDDNDDLFGTNDVDGMWVET